MADRVRMRVTNDQLRQIAVNRVQDFPCPYEVIIQEIKPNRSVAQNSLYWTWMAYLAGETGHTKDELHMQMKKQFLDPIMRANPERFPDYNETLRTLAEVKKHDKGTAVELWRQVLRLVSTTALGVREFTEYLNEIESFWAGHMGIDLPHPEDRYYEAMS